LGKLTYFNIFHFSNLEKRTTYKTKFGKVFAQISAGNFIGVFRVPKKKITYT